MAHGALAPQSRTKFRGARLYICLNAQWCMLAAVRPSSRPQPILVEDGNAVNVCALYKIGIKAPRLHSSASNSPYRHHNSCCQLHNWIQHRIGTDDWHCEYPEYQIQRILAFGTTALVIRTADSISATKSKTYVFLSTGMRLAVAAWGETIFPMASRHLIEDSVCARICVLFDPSPSKFNEKPRQSPL